MNSVIESELTALKTKVTDTKLSFEDFYTALAVILEKVKLDKSENISLTIQDRTFDLDLETMQKVNEIIPINFGS